MASESGKAIVLDSTCFIQAWKLPDFQRFALFTTGLVAGELRSAEASARFSQVGRVKIRNPSKESVEKAKKLSEKIGDRRLSEADVSVLALALELALELPGAAVATDDYSLQNACSNAGIDFFPVSFRGIGKKRKFSSRKLP
ncbi:MAG: hypothetical protein V1820_05135 [archaeon]